MQGTQTEGRFPRDAIVQLEVNAGSLMGGKVAHGPVSFDSVAAAAEQAPFQLTQAAFEAAAAFAAAARLRRMTDEVCLPTQLLSRYFRMSCCRRKLKVLRVSHLCRAL